MLSKFIFPFYLLFLSLFTIWLSKYPIHNGDMPFYIVCAIQLEQGSMNGAVEKAVVYLKQELHTDEFIEHSGRITKVPIEYFDFYRIKPLYILMVLLFHKAGFSFTTATIVPSLLCFFLIGITIWRFSIQYLDPVKTFLVSVICMIIYPTSQLARLSTPDAMSCFFLLNALFFIYTGRSNLIWFSLLLLALCTRLDNIIAELIILFALLNWPDSKFPAKLRAREFVLSAMILIAVAALINFIFTQHFVRLNDPINERSVSGYLENLKGYLYVFSRSFLMSLLILFIFTIPGRGFSWRDKVNYMIYVILVIVFIRFLIYPFYEERFLTPFTIFGMLIISYRYSGTKNIDSQVTGNAFNPE
ncbi:MAG TPA: hypothetical protein VHT72_01640 [Puia sp.]|nr:hypothetical protein [Puia sp.]